MTTPAAADDLHARGAGGGLLHRRLVHRASSRAVQRLRQIAASERPIVAGPWVGDVGLELLYWVPLLRGLVDQERVPPERIFAISRGGAADLYADVAGGYADLCTLVHPEELGAWAGPRSGALPKPSAADKRAVEAALAAAGFDGSAARLHPRLLENLFLPFWERGDRRETALAHLSFRPVAPPPFPERYALESPYVVVDCVFTPAFPDTPANRGRLALLVADLAERTRVVLLNPFGDLRAYRSATVPRDRPGLLDGKTALSLQARLVAGADALIAPYGSIAFLGPFTATPTLAIYSVAAIRPAHFDMAQRSSHRIAVAAGTPERLFRTRHVDAIDLELLPLRAAVAGSDAG